MNPPVVGDCVRNNPRDGISGWDLQMIEGHEGKRLTVLTTYRLTCYITPPYTCTPDRRRKMKLRNTRLSIRSGTIRDLTVVYSAIS